MKNPFINLRKNLKFKDIPVIVYSTTANAREIESFKKLGAAHFVVKPPRFEELVAVLKDISVTCENVFAIRLTFHSLRSFLGCCSPITCLLFPIFMHPHRTISVVISTELENILGRCPWFANP